MQFILSTESLDHSQGSQESLTVSIHVPLYITFALKFHSKPVLIKEKP